MNLEGLIMGIVIAVILAAVGAAVLQGVFDQQTANSYAQNISGEGLTAMDDLSGWFPLIVIVGVAGVILSLLFVAFRNKSGQ